MTRERTAPPFDEAADPLRRCLATLIEAAGRIIATERLEELQGT